MKIICFLICFSPLLIVAQIDEKQLTKKGMDITQHIPKGLEKGAKAPKIEGFSVDGEFINAENILKEKQIVLLFYRGKWCPICNRYLSNLNDSLEFITNENAEVIVVGPESIENAQKTREKSNANFILIPDTSSKILTAYDVLFSVTKKYQNKIKTLLFSDIAKINQQEEAALPVPATYIIGRDGTIKWRHFNYDYSVRATAKEIIENLK